MAKSYQLSGLDATFLYLESAETPMHVGSLHLYTLPPKFKGDFTQTLRKHLASRLHLVPIFTRRLQTLPFDIGHPSWQKVVDVDLQYHVKRIDLPKPGTTAQMESYCAKLHSQLIDRSKPLWEFYVFEGLASGEIGFYSKIHHATLDGKAGTVLANAILDITTIPRIVETADPARAVRPPTPIAKLVGAALSNSLAQYAKIVRALPSAVSTIGAAAFKNRGAGIGLAPKTIFNQNVSNQRSFVTARVDQAEAKAIGKALGGSINDVVLYLCSTALRAYLTKHGGIPKKSLIAMMPVSLRQEGNNDLNNQASMMLVSLGSHLTDSHKRFAAILESTQKVKAALSSLKGVMPTDYPSLLTPWLVSGLAGTYNKSRIANYIPMPANVVISNVPGPTVPLYLAGAQMTSFHPLSIIVHGVALNITVQTYAGHIDFGIICCKQAVPQARSIAKAVEASFRDLQKITKLHSG
jgi:diacylglycerol O-acyltransferase / wax synthase